MRATFAKLWGKVRKPKADVYKGMRERSVFSILAEHMPEPYDPQKMSDNAFVNSDGPSSVMALHHTVEMQIVETKADRERWINAPLGEIACWQFEFQNKINAAFAQPLMKAVMWALDGEMNGVSDAAVKHIAWQDESPTGEISQMALTAMFANA